MRTYKKVFDKADITAYGEKNISESTALLYHENSKLTQYTSRQMGEDVSAFNNGFFSTRASQPYKHYPGNKLIQLKDYEDIHNDNVNDIYEIIKKRRSVRAYDNTYKISLNELYRICYYTYGISHKAPLNNTESGGSWSFRNVPSGGGLFPLELYLVVLNGDITKGLYHYRPDINGLEFLKQGEYQEELCKIITAEPYVDLKSASAILLVTSIFERTMIKYKDRGYRFILMEVGFTSQNASLICEALGLGSCMIGGYLDDKVNDFLGVDGTFETIQNVIVIGKGNTNEKNEISAENLS